MRAGGSCSGWRLLTLGRPGSVPSWPTTSHLGLSPRPGTPRDGDRDGTSPHRCPLNSHDRSRKKKKTNQQLVRRDAACPAHCRTFQKLSKSTRASSTGPQIFQLLPRYVRPTRRNSEIAATGVRRPYGPRQMLSESPLSFVYPSLCDRAIAFPCSSGPCSFGTLLSPSDGLVRAVR